MRVWYNKIISKDRFQDAYVAPKTKEEWWIKYEETRSEDCCSEIAESHEPSFEFEGIEGPGVYITYTAQGYDGGDDVETKIEFCPFCGAKHEIIEEKVVEMRKVVTTRVIPQREVEDEDWKEVKR